MGIDIETLAAARKYANKAAKEEGVNQDFPSDFVTNKTTAEFCASITSCAAVKQGNSFMGAVTLTDMPFNGNAECRVDVIHSQLGGFILALELISATEAPYRWYGVYWKTFGGWQALITDAHLQEEYAVDVSESTGGDYAKSYIVKQGGKTLSTINIPKDMVVSDEYTAHIKNSTASVEGVHGLRYYNGALQWDNNGTWIPIKISDLLI